MSSGLPYPIGAPFPPTKPTTTIPQGQGAPKPPSAWFSGDGTQLNWVASAEDNIVAETFFRSPVFDQRPDLGVLSTDTLNQTTGAQALWNPCQFHISIYIGDYEGIQVECLEEAHPTLLPQVARTQDWQDITANVTNTGEPDGGWSTLTFVPYSRIRYWRLQLRFRLLAGTAAQEGPEVYVYAGMY